LIHPEGGDYLRTRQQCRQFAAGNLTAFPLPWLLISRLGLWAQGFDLLQGSRAEIGRK